jgi:hypothetical protein
LLLPQLFFALLLPHMHYALLLLDQPFLTL